jgi:hypothetical protein
MKFRPGACSQPWGQSAVTHGFWKGHARILDVAELTDFGGGAPRGACVCVTFRGAVSWRRSRRWRRCGAGGSPALSWGDARVTGARWRPDKGTASR